MSDAPTPEDVYRAAAEVELDDVHALAFNAVTRVLPVDRFVSLTERQAVADAVVAAVEPVIMRAAYAAGREAAAQALRDADWWVNDDRPSAEVMHAFFAHAAEIARGGR